MQNRQTLNVFAGDMLVGKLAMYDKYRVAFEYSDEWIANGFSISPYSLPLEKKVFVPSIDLPFEGLFGVFWDSLPDGWGRLLVDRMLVSKGENPDAINSLTRLAIVGDNGMGLLSYRPEIETDYSIGGHSYDELASEAAKILNDQSSKCLDDLFAMGASSGGARPKLLTKIDGEDWIIKFRTSQDPKNIGEIEYRYNECARKCEIDVPDFKLLDSTTCSGYFATKRFDRNPRLHMISVSALLEVSHRVPALDYNTLMQLTLSLTKDYSEVEKMFRLMCFNVFAHNRDDHSNNFSFIYKDNGWKLSPAYDLTYSNSIGGEHATSVNGNGKEPGMKEILAVADKIGMNKGKAIKIADELNNSVGIMYNYPYKETYYGKERPRIKND